MVDVDDVESYIFVHYALANSVIVQYNLEGRRQKAEGRRQKAEGRRQKAEGRLFFNLLKGSFSLIPWFSRACSRRGTISIHRQKTR
jgi:hypothetical protein